jgi:PAS domain S-box-containing protein
MTDALQVLYVDDEPELLTMVKLFFEVSDRFYVDTAVSAPEALLMMEKKHYDAIISDYQMPGMDGLAFLKTIRGSGNTIPFIIFTGRGREEIVIQAFNEGADFYLQKGGDPVSLFAELENQIRHAAERRRADERIRETEQRLSDIINFLPDATFAIDRSGQVIAWNNAIEEMTGVRADGMLGKGDHEYAVPFYGSRRTMLIDRILEPGGAIIDDYTHIDHRDGTVMAETSTPQPRGKRLVVMSKASPLYNREGKVIGAIESIRDITDLKMIETTLRESESRFRNIYNTSPIAIEIYDREGRLVEVNPACCELFGIESADSVRGFNLFDDPNIPLARREVLKSGTMVRYESEFDFELVKSFNLYKTTRSGTVSLDVLITPILEKEAVITGYLVQILDITHRKQSEKALQDERGRLQHIIEGTRAGTWEWDVQTGETIFNERWAEILGYTLDELSPVSIRTWEALAHPDDLKWSGDLLERHFSGELPFYDCKCRMKHKDGHWVWVLDRGRIITRTPDGKPLMMFGTHTDITELKNAEDALRQSNRQLKLLGGITRHDILNKVTVIQGYLDIMAMRFPDPALRQFVDKLDSAIGAIKSQITFTKVYQDLGSQDPQWQDLHEVLLRSQFPASICLKSEIQGFFVFADPLLEKVFSNLLDNSVRHGQHVTEIRVTTQQTGGGLNIVWEDNGTGIPVDEKEKIFNRGFGKNTGFGLFLVREILSLTDIAIKETGVPGKGARFEIMVPQGMYRTTKGQ